MRERQQPVELARRLRQRMTPQEVKVWNWLREGPVLQGHHFRRQPRIGPYIVDFACLGAGLVVEIDGSQHGLDEGVRVDMLRDEALGRLGYRVLRFWNHEVDLSKEVVMDTIFAALRDPSWRQ
jgi:very-short-patch-repair endonuclease